MYLLNCIAINFGLSLCEDPVVSGATCWLNQKERKLIPCLLFLPYNEAMLPYIEAEQLVPARPPPINHPWILSFPHDSTIDYSYYQQLQLFTFDENVSNLNALKALLS